MTTTINADNGVSSGSAGLKSSADSSGVLALQTNGTTALSISTAQVVSFTNPLAGSTGASLVLIQRQTASSSSSLDFTTGIDSTYDEYVATVTKLIPATDATALRIRFSNNAGSSWITSTDYAYVLNQMRASDGANVSSYNNGSSYIAFGDQIPNSSTNGGMNGWLHFHLITDSVQNKQVSGHGSYLRANTLTVTILGGNISGSASASAVNGIQFSMSSGNITSGAIALYGVKKS